MQNRLLLIATGLVIASCASRGGKLPEPGPPPAATAHSYEDLVKAADRYAEAGRSKNAQNTAARAIALEPTEPAAYVILGRSLAQQKKLKESALQYEQARQLGSGDRRMFLELASIYDITERYEESVGVYRAFLDGSPNDVEMLQELGLTLLLLERFDAAVSELDRAAAARPDDVQLAQDLGYALLQAQKPGRAAKILQRVVNAEPNRKGATLFLARARAAEGKAQKALDLLNRIITVRTASEPALRMRAQLLSITGDSAGAERDFQRLLRAKPNDPAALLGIAGVYIQLSQLDKAAQALSRLENGVTDHELAHFRRAQIGWRKGEKSALQKLATFARAHPAHIGAWRDLRLAAKKLGNRGMEKEAKSRLKKLGDL